MKIIDAHHHYWDPSANYHPWLRDKPMIPFRYGDYSSICDKFMNSEYDVVTQDWDVVATVTMEGEWDPADPTGEAIWMQRQHDETGRPAAHVAQAWLDSDNIVELLAAYQALPIVRSVRHKPRFNDRPGGAVGGMMDKAFREGFCRLADSGLIFDLQTPWWHLNEAIDMAQLAPETKIVLNHAGLPSDRSAEGLAGWRAAMTEFAALPQTYVKISGLGLPERAWSIADNKDIIRFCINTFGPERAMFASNFPVDGLCGSFDTIYSGFMDVTSADAEGDRDQLFYKTAKQVYGL
ncbi:thioesterase [Amylibacter kogurei]|uniref:Thioesterase n=1 Tax=Paramylibacter kogurei TaxID=1889778 RepID=A0A2G5KBA5_9RHOB|nr:amidohydrolase family protein [Amylibacter kogurei]PIB26459.1 thioesterase [Amylibacter kogurei]